MVLTYTQEHTYHHPWDRVTAAAWRKFTDPEASSALSHVVDVHTLSRRLDPESGRLHTTRSITVRSPPLPFPLRALTGGGGAVFCHCIETTIADSGRRRMEVVARNIGLRRLIEVEERSVYEPHPLDPDRWTAFRQETRIRCKPLSALASIAEKVEQRCAERFLQNSAKGRDFVERICRYLEAEGSSAAAAATAAASP